MSEMQTVGVEEQAVPIGQSLRTVTPLAAKPSGTVNSIRYDPAWQTLHLSELVAKNLDRVARSSFLETTEACPAWMMTSVLA